MLDSVLFQHAAKMDTRKKKIRHILHVFFDKSENSNQIAEGVHVPDTVTADRGYVNSVPINTKDPPRSERPVVKNIDKIIEIGEFGRNVFNLFSLPKSETFK